jgi:synaptic vesicle membrane protein VAT-1
MKQVWIPKIGTPEVLEVREAADPTPGAGEVRVRVHAAGINFADIMARMGLYPDAPPVPSVVGYEVSGVVDALGAGVQGVSEGQRVTAMTRFGGYTDTLIVPAGQIAPIADAMSFETAAAIPVNYLTAWLMLVRLGNVQAGERVLVHAAAGGVGQAALQICLLKGAEVIGTASAPKHERLRAAGVAHCIDYRSQDFEAEVKRITKGEGVHIALDAVGGKSFGASYRSLASLGRLFVFGSSSAAPGNRRNILAALKSLASVRKFGPMDLMDKNRGVFGVNLGHLWHIGDEMAVMLKEIVALTEAGKLAPVVDATFPLERASDAHAYIQARKNFGKVLLTTGR